MKKRISTRSVFFVFIFAIVALSAIILFRHFRLTANQEALLNPTESIAASPFAQDTVLAPNPSAENSEVLPNTGTPTIGVYAVSASNIWVDSKTGNDANNGQSPDKAYRTIQKAASVAGPGATIHIMPGVYRESIRPGMSGTVSAPIRYIAEKGPGTVIIRGSEPASSLSWTQLTSNSIGLPSGVNPANIYSTDLSAWGLKSPPRFIVETNAGGDIVTRWMPAHEPDWKVETEWKVSEFWWTANGGSGVAGCDPSTNSDHQCDLSNRSFTQLTDTADDSDPAGIQPGNLTSFGDLTGATLVALDAQHGTYFYRRTVTAHDVAAGIVTVDENADNDGAPGLGWGSKYYVENHPALLNQPGEWWFDVKSGRLYLWPASGQNPASSGLEIARLDTGFDLTDRSYISLEGLTVDLFNGDAYQIQNGNNNYEAHGDSLIQVKIRYANRGIVLYQYAEGAASEYAIDGFHLENSEIAYMDTTGLDASFSWPGAPKPDQFGHPGILNTVIRNNQFHHLGYNSDNRSGVGIRVFYPDKIRFEGNYVHHIAQNGAHFHLSSINSSKSYGFSPQEIQLGEILIKDNVFEKACQLNSDCGALKFGGSQRPYTHVFRDVLITGNVFRDTFGWSYASVKRTINQTGDANGFYLDMASGVHVYRNIAYNNSGAGFKLACLWRDGDAVFFNNIAANNYAFGFKFTGDKTCDDHSGSVNTQLVNNIIINNDAYGFQFTSSYDNQYGNLVIDHNLYYNNGWNEQAAANQANIQLFEGNQGGQYFHTLKDIQSGTSWEAHGKEGDPRFANYNLNNHDRNSNVWPDFHLTNDSANAIDLGTADLPASLKQLLAMFGVNEVKAGSAYDIGRYEGVGAQAAMNEQVYLPILSEPGG